MNADCKKSMKESARAFALHQPTFIKALVSLGLADRSSRLVTNESYNNSGFKLLLDGLAGVDYWLESDFGVKAIAARMQAIDNVFYTTATIRTVRSTGSKTEYEKRLNAIKNGDLYPKYTIQGYYNRNGDRLAGFAIIDTLQLLTYVKDGYDGTEYKTGTNSEDGNLFAVADWYLLEASGVGIHIYNLHNTVEEIEKRRALAKVQWQYCLDSREENKQRFEYFEQLAKEKFQKYVEHETIKLLAEFL